MLTTPMTQEKGIDRTRRKGGKGERRREGGEGGKKRGEDGEGGKKRKRKKRTG